MKTLKNSRRWLVITSLIMALAIPSYAEEKKPTEKVKLDECPAAVQKTIKQNTGGGKILEIEKTEEKGSVVYEAEVEKDGKKFDIEVAADGKLIKVEDDEEGDEESGEEGKKD